MAKAALAGVLLFTFVVAGCTALNNLIKLGGDIQDAGYRSVSCNSNSVNGHTVLDIAASTTGDAATDDDGKRIAEVVWKSYDGTFDELHVTVNGATVMDATPSELTDMFGDRPAGVVTEDKGSDYTLVIVLTAVGALVLAGLVVLVWWRGRKPPPPVLPPTYYQRPPPAGHSLGDR